MPTFSYTAYNKEGQQFKGTTTAPDLKTAKSHLKTAGHFITNIAEKKEFDPILIFSKVSDRDLYLFFHQFADMVNAGMTILSCLTSLETQNKNKEFQKIIKEIRLDIENGSSLSSAMARHKKVFSDLYINMIKVGEAAGVLGDILNRIAEYIENKNDLRQKLISSFMYPALLLTAAVAVLTLMLVFVVPSFMKVYLQLKVDLPWPTVVMMHISNFIMAYKWLILFLMIILIAAYPLIRRTPEGKRSIDFILMKFPLVGPLNRSIVVARFIRTLGTLIESNVPIVRSLDIVELTVNNAYINDLTNKIRSSVMSGGSIAEPIKKFSWIPDSVQQIVTTGESSGNLGEMLHKGADSLDKEVSHNLKRIMVSLEPLLTVILGGIIAFIALAVYLPVFDLMDTMSK